MWRNLDEVSAFKLIHSTKEGLMHGIIYLVGLVVIIMAVLSLLGLR